MRPTEKEIRAAVEDENEALLELSAALKQGEKAELRIKAARKRLSLARAHKSAIVNDALNY